MTVGTGLGRKCPRTTAAWRGRSLLAWGAVLSLASAGAALASPGNLLKGNGSPIDIRRADGGITVDGNLSEAAWAEAARIDAWFETQPGDNLPASLRSVGLVTYDDDYLYVAFDLADPDPGAIRAPLLDRDAIPPSVDFAGLYLDPAGEGKTAQEFAGTPRGVQYDGVYSEAAGPDAAPDFFWECAGSINSGGWSLEMRIPFASLRYQDPNPSHWGILMYRLVPRSYRYEYFSSRMPRERACSLCNALPLEGLRDLPTGSHWVAAPYFAAGLVETPSGGAGAPLDTMDRSNDVGVDLKWLPNPGTVVDAAWNPDFSQVESDAAQITANERFALLFDEKRPFFLESRDLFTTPLSAAHTRSITAPRWGLRGTGVGDGYTYTVLAGEDRGGGSVIIPGSQGSSFASQDFSSLFLIGRVRREVGRSFASFLVTDREVEGGGFNRVAGPDVEWRPTEQDIVLGQLLWSWTETPDRPDLAEEWDGRSLSGHAGEITWLRNTGTWDVTLSYQDTADGFRADNGYIPQVGFHKGYAEIGRTFWPKEGIVTRLRLFAISSDVTDRDGGLLYRQITPGFGFDSLLDSFVRFDFGFDEIRAGETVFRRAQIRPTVRFRPGKMFPLVEFQGVFGDEVDFSQARPGKGATLRLDSEARPTDHLQLLMTLRRRWLDVEAAGERGGDRLFTADIARLNATYSFTVRSWLRLIGQWVETERNPLRYVDAVRAREADFAGSLTFAYKLNWQTVLYLGYGDSRTLDDLDELRRCDRQAFFKVSYAFQS